MKIRLLTPADAPAYQARRLSALQAHPTAFSSSYEEECGTPIATIAEQLGPQHDRARLGAFDDESLCGILAIRRDDMQKVSHKATIWGVYVAPEARQAGVGRQLFSLALRFALDELKVRQVNLSVNAKNAPAIALYQRMGFEQYGLERRYLIVNGEPQDEHHMVHFLDGWQPSTLV